MMKGCSLKTTKSSRSGAIAYYVNVIYDKRNQEWKVARYDEQGNELERQLFHFKSNAKWVANQWMDKHQVTRVYIYKVNGKVDDIIFNSKRKTS